MKNLFIALFLVLFLSSCSTTRNTNTDTTENPVRIANDELEYEIIIFDVGFESYLSSIAKPKSYYSINYLENKNRTYVSVWNSRARNPSQYNSSIYENVIDYDYNIHYGVDVNYTLFNYFKFVEYKYRERFF